MIEIDSHGLEAKTSHDLPSASCRPRKADDMAQSKSEGLRTRHTDV